MNKKENSENLVKKMFLLLSVMSFFASAGIENVNAMNQNSIFGDVNKGRSDSNGKHDATPLAAPMPTMEANNSQQNITPVSTLPTNQPNSGYRLVVSAPPISDQNTGVSGGSKIIDMVKKDPGVNNGKNESILGSLGDKSESFCSEGYSVRFVFPIPEPSEDVTNIVNGDVVEYLKNIDSVDDIPACMYDHILKALDQQNSDKNITILLLELYGVNVDGFLERDKSVSLLVKTLYATFKEAQENSKCNA